MGQMTQKWNITGIRKKISSTLELSQKKVVDELFQICISAAQRAKNEHDYNNYKGELESSIGVIVLKDRQEIMQWSMLAKSGSDPAKGLQDMRNVIYDEIVGKSTLPDGTHIPSKSIIGIIFAAAPYAGTVESYGRRVLIDFAPNDNQTFKILKTIIR